MSVKAKSSKVAVSLKDIGVAYNTKVSMFRKEKYWALKNVSFDICYGETIGIIGKNGVGKSTLMKLIAGVMSSDRGRVVNKGATVTLLSLQVGFIPHLTGRENAILSGMMLGLSKMAVLAKMPAIEDYANIGEFFDKAVREYSSGMRARLGFSVAIHIEPDIILLDEVLGVGDAEFRAKSVKEMTNIINSNKTIILVSHNMRLIRQVCDKVIWIQNGEVQMIGSADEVLATYESSTQL